jgi:hypothetical protein
MEQMRICATDMDTCACIRTCVSEARVVGFLSSSRPNSAARVSLTLQPCGNDTASGEAIRSYSSAVVGAEYGTALHRRHAAASTLECKQSPVADSACVHVGVRCAGCDVHA